MWCTSEEEIEYFPSPRLNSALTVICAQPDSTLTHSLAALLPGGNLNRSRRLFAPVVVNVFQRPVTALITTIITALLGMRVWLLPYLWEDWFRR